MCLRICSAFCQIFFLLLLFIIHHQFPVMFSITHGRHPVVPSISIYHSYVYACLCWTSQVGSIHYGVDSSTRLWRRNYFHDSSYPAQLYLVGDSAATISGVNVILFFPSFTWVWKHCGIPSISSVSFDELLYSTNLMRHNRYIDVYQ